MDFPRGRCFFAISNEREYSVASCLISLGANVGNASGTINAAVEQLRSYPGVSDVKQSRLIATMPAGGPAGQGEFVNGAALFETTLLPLELLELLQSLESRAGRVRDVRWDERTLDLDIIFYDDLVQNGPTLMVPHPRMAFRRFVLEPSAEIAATFRHPISGHSVSELLQHLNTAPNYVAVTGVAGAGKTNLVQEACKRIDAIPVTTPGLATNASNPPSSAVEVELEFLQRCVESLAEKQIGCDAKYVISDFWCGQSLACTSGLPPTEVSRLESACDDCPEQAMRPRLIVLLECDFREMSSVDAKAFTQRQDKLREILLSPGQVPVLRLRASDAEWNVEEIVAAIHAM